MEFIYICVCFIYMYIDIYACVWHIVSNYREIANLEEFFKKYVVLGRKMQWETKGREQSIRLASKPGFRLPTACLHT